MDDPKNRRSGRQVALNGRHKAAPGVLGAAAETGIRSGLALFFRKGTPLRRDNLWKRYMLPKVEAVGLSWATFQVMRRTFATWSKKAGVDAHTHSAQMGNTVDVNENEYAVASFEQKLVAVRRLETAVVQ